MLSPKAQRLARHVCLFPRPCLWMPQHPRRWTTRGTCSIEGVSSKLSLRIEVSSPIIIQRSRFCPRNFSDRANAKGRSNANDEYHSAIVDRTQHLIQPARRDLGYSHGWASSDVQLDDRGDQDHGASPEGDEGISPSSIRRGRSRVETGSHKNSTSSQTTFEAQDADDKSITNSKKKGNASIKVKVPLIVRQIDAHNESPVSNLTFQTAYYTLITGSYHSSIHEREGSWFLSVSYALILDLNEHMLTLEPFRSQSLRLRSTSTMTKAGFV